MFVYCNGKISILANARCGSTSMYQYFNIEYNSLDEKTIDHWKWYGDFGITKVVILRNPYDRVSSAYNIIHLAERQHMNPGLFFGQHSCPYLWALRDMQFEFIDFYELNLYLPISFNTTISDSKKNASFNYITNPLYDEESLKQEYIDYNTILNSRHKLTVDQWKYMTQ